MSVFQTISNSFVSIQSVGTLILLSFLLLISLIIGWLSGRNISSSQNYLYSPGEMRGWEFGLSETAYMIAVGTTLVLLSSLTFQFGPFFLIVVFFSWLISLFVYSRLALKGDLIEFYRDKGAHIGNYIIGESKQKSRSENILLWIISIIIGITFFGYFVTEILALKVLMNTFEPARNVTGILGGALILVILYTTIGGYKGVFRTDVIQTSFFIIVLIFIIGLGVIKIRPLSFSPFMKLGFWESIIILISYAAIGVASLITGLDIWARMRASEGKNLRQGEKGLWWSLITLVPFILVCFFGIMFSSLGQNVIGSNPDFNKIIPVVTSAIGIPLGFMLVFLISLTISTADTSLITISQAVEPLIGDKIKTIGFFRILAGIISILGLIIALAIPIPKTIQAMLLTISFPVALTPIVFIRRYSGKKKVNSKIAIISITLSSIFGISIGVMNPDYASYSAAVILISATAIYVLCASGVKLFNFAKSISSKKQEKKKNARTS